jgi:dihydrofolate reductase
MFESAGAVVIGRRMFDVGIGHWGNDGAFGMPCFVVTHHPVSKMVKGPTTFEFCESISRALILAQEAAGDRDVVVAGGADIAQQCLALGVVDELRLHVVPVLLGFGTSLFAETPSPVELKTTDVAVSPNATHIALTVV